MKKQTTIPNKGNPFYNTTSNGGYSWCIQGKPTQDGLNVLDNCVGYSCGRFNEVYSTETGYKGMKYPQLNCNAENFIERGKSVGLTYQYDPIVGGIMVWEGIGSLAGHVANVEEVLSDGGVLTSESGWKHFAFRNYTRYKGDGAWGLDRNKFKYLGCIINPANPKPEPTPEPSEYPFNGIVKKGSKLYSESGNQYKNPASKDRPVQVLGEVNGKYKVYGDTFNPHIVYVNKGDVVKQGAIYPFEGIVLKGSPLYNEYGGRYKNGASANRNVTVQGEVNGRYKVYGSTFNPHVVYVDKENVIRR